MSVRMSYDSWGQNGPYTEDLDTVVLESSWFDGLWKTPRLTILKWSLNTSPCIPE